MPRRCTRSSSGSASATATCRKASFRCDANVSVRPVGQDELGTRCEIKNLNSFRFMQQAIEFEVRRQIELIEDGGTVVQETRLYDPDRDETRSMRSKEDAMDYRYFPDPDLLPLAIAHGMDRAVRARNARAARRDARALRARIRPARVRRTDADRVAANLPTYFEAVAGAVADKKLAANWVMGEFSAALNEAGACDWRQRRSPRAAGRAGRPRTRRHDQQQDREGRVRRAVGGRGGKRRCDHRSARV